MCSTESMRYTKRCIYYFPLLPATLFLHQGFDLANCSFGDHFRTKLPRFTGNYRICLLSSHGEWRAWVTIGSWCDLKGCFSNPNLPQPRPPCVTKRHTLFERGWECEDSGGGILVLAGLGPWRGHANPWRCGNIPVMCGSLILEQFTTSMLGI